MAQIQWSLWAKGRNEAASRAGDRWTRASLVFAETAPACLSKLLYGLSPFFARLDTTGDVHAAKRFTRAQTLNCNLHIPLSFKHPPTHPHLCFSSACTLLHGDILLAPPPFPNEPPLDTHLCFSNAAVSGCPYPDA